MKRKFYLKAAVIAAAALFCAGAFFSCAQASDGESGQVVFSISKDLASDLSDDFEMEIRLLGAVTRSETISVKEGATVAFDDLPLGATVKVSGQAYIKGENDHKHFLYEGETELFKVYEYTPITLNFTRFYYITYDLKGGSWASLPPPSGRYQKGKPFALPTSNDLKYDGRLFAGWCVSEDGGQTLQDFAFTNETKGDFTLYAKWIDCAVLGIEVAIDRYASDIGLSYETVEIEKEGAVLTGIKFTVTPPAELPDNVPTEVDREEGTIATTIDYIYEWRVDGANMGDIGSEGEPTFTFIKNGRQKGVYDIEVRVKVQAWVPEPESPDGKGYCGWAEYSAFAQVNVTE